MTRAASTTTPRKRTPAKVVQAVPEPVEDEDPGDGREWAEFPFQDIAVKLYRPSGGQAFILLQTVSITDESADVQEKVELALAFATMLRSLFVEAEARVYVTGALARGKADIEDYFELARAMAELWGLESEPPNREERRARERKPVAKAAPRRAR
jgi:hypothetical protein